MNEQKSFTLIELLVVIVIIGILAGVIMISTSSSIDKANFAKAQAFSSTVQNELLSNLVSEWTFDNSFNLGEDTWGNNHGTLYNFANPATSTSGLASANECVFGTCLKFDGTDDYINCGNTVILKPKIMTIGLWMYRLEGNGYIFSFGAYGGAGSSGYHLMPNFFAIFKIKGDSGICKSSIGNNYTNQWTYLVGLYDGSTVKFYQNGQEVGTETSCAGQIIYNTSSVKTAIGAMGYSNMGYFNGLIDDVRFYDAALPSSQIKQNYIAGLNSMLANGNMSKQEYKERINALAYDN